MFNINIIDKCFQCGQAYRQKDADLLWEKGDYFVFHLTCRKCQASAIMQTNTGQKGVLSIGKLTDASKKDLDKIRQAKPISVDYVIEAYKEFKSNSN